MNWNPRVLNLIADRNSVFTLFVSVIAIAVLAIALSVGRMQKNMTIEQLVNKKQTSIDPKPFLTETISGVTF